MIDAPLPGTPIWISAAAAVIRRLPAGRIRAMNWVGGRQLDPFWTKLPPDLGSLSFRCDLRDGLMREVCFTGRYEPQETARTSSSASAGNDVHGRRGQLGLLHR